MSRDTVGILKKTVTAREIFDAIVDLYDKEAYYHIKDNGHGGCGYIYFYDGEEAKGLFYSITSDSAEHTEFDRVPHTSISLGVDEDSIKIISNILKKYGGYIDEDDCDEIGYRYIPKSGEEVTYSDFILKRNEVMEILSQDTFLSEKDKLLLATKIIKYKEKLKKIL